VADRHEVKYVRQSDLGDFIPWLADAVSVKALTACYLEDIRTLLSDQLRDGRWDFTAETTKNRSEWPALLPPELLGYRGERFLWKRYPLEIIAANQARGWPTHRQKSEFAPRRLGL